MYQCAIKSSPLLLSGPSALTRAWVWIILSAGSSLTRASLQWYCRWEIRISRKMLSPATNELVVLPTMLVDFDRKYIIAEDEFPHSTLTRFMLLIDFVDYVLTRLMTRGLCWRIQFFADKVSINILCEILHTEFNFVVAIFTVPSDFLWGRIFANSLIIKLAGLNVNFRALISYIYFLVIYTTREL